MTIVGIGVDIVEVDRIIAAVDRHGDRFVQRITRPGEVRVPAGPGFGPHVAGLFAAKEATLKALGTGWAAGLGFRQIEVHRPDGGRPEVRLHGAAAERARDLGSDAVHLSISHERSVAIAFAVLERTDC